MGITGHCVLTLCPRSAAHSRPRHCTPGSRRSWGSRLPRPLHRGAASASTKSRPRAQSVHSGLHVHRRTHSEAVPGFPRRTESDGTTTPLQCSKDGPLRQPRRHRNRLQGPDTPPLFTRHRIVSSCTVLVLPSDYKRRGLGPFWGGGTGSHEEPHSVTRTLPCCLRATSQAARTTPCRDLGPAPSLF